MDFKKTRQAVMLYALETTPGVVPADNQFIAALVNMGAKSDKTSTAISREVLSSDFGTFGNMIVSSMFKTTFEQELKALGRNAGAIVAPEWVYPLQACATVQTDAYVINLSALTGTYKIGEVVKIVNDPVGIVIDATDTVVYVRKTDSTSVAATNHLIGADSTADGTVDSVTTAIVFEPTSSEALMKSLSIRFNEGGILKGSKYARGNAVITCSPKALPKVAFDFQALYIAPTDTALPNVSVSGVKPLPFQGVGLTLGGLDVALVAFDEFTLDLGNTVVAIDDAKAANGIAAVTITDAMPTVKMSISQPALSAYNPFADHEAQTERNIAVVYGAGDKFIRIGIRKAQLSAIAEADKNGNKSYNLDFTANKGGLTPKWYLMVY